MGMKGVSVSSPRVVGAIRNEMIQNTENHDPLLQLAAMMGGLGPAIERQEAQGQQQLTQSSQLPAKNNGREDITAFYQACGIKVIGPSKGDRLFLDVQLPEGWKINPTDHSMWSNLVDANGCVRASIFYKAAFYDREAFINMQCRYRTMFDMMPKNDAFWRYRVIDAKTGENLAEDEWKNYGDAAQNHDHWKGWLAERFPNHADPTAYWND